MCEPTPAGQILTSGGLDEGVAAGAEDGDEQGRLEIDFAGFGIVDRNLVAGVVNEQLLSTAVFLPKNHVELTFPVAVQLTKARITIPSLMILAIFFPHQLERQIAVGLQLPPNGIEVRPGRFLPHHRWTGSAGHNFFQPPVVPVRRQRPTHTGGRRGFQILVDGALGDHTTAGNLLLFEPERMESENFFQFAQAEPHLWQLGSSTSQWKPRRLLSLLNFLY